MLYELSTLSAEEKADRIEVIRERIADIEADIIKYRKLRMRNTVKACKEMVQDMTLNLHILAI